MPPQIVTLLVGTLIFVLLYAVLNWLMGPNLLKASSSVIKIVIVILAILYVIFLLSIVPWGAMHLTH